MLSATHQRPTSANAGSERKAALLGLATQFSVSGERTKQDANGTNGLATNKNIGQKDPGLDKVSRLEPTLGDRARVSDLTAARDQNPRQAQSLQVDFELLLPEETDQSGYYTLCAAQLLEQSRSSGPQAKQVPTERLYAIQCHSFFGEEGVVGRASALLNEGVARPSHSKNEDIPHDIRIAGKPDRLNQFFAGSKDHWVDKPGNNHAAVHFVPGRKNTRSKQAQSGCFLCHWEDQSRPYVLSNQTPNIIYTLNGMPYTRNTHYLVATREHDTQDFNSDVLGTVIDRINEHANIEQSKGNKPGLVGYYSGRIGNSQKHHHWHMVDMPSQLLNFLGTDPKRTPLAQNDNGSISWITSNALRHPETGKISTDDQGKPLVYFDCLLLEGSKSYLTNWAQKIVEHLEQPAQCDQETRALYNMALLPPKEENGSPRAVIFPRKIIERDAEITSRVFDREKPLDPGANEYAGNWVLACEPKADVQPYDVAKALYELVQAGRPDRDRLELDQLFLHKN